GTRDTTTYSRLAETIASCLHSEAERMKYGIGSMKFLKEATESHQEAALRMRFHRIRTSDEYLVIVLQVRCISCSDSGQEANYLTYSSGWMPRLTSRAGSRWPLCILN